MKRQTKAESTPRSFKDSWAFWVLDKLIIAILVVAVTSGFNVWAEKKKVINTATVADATKTVEKAGELWSAAGEYKASLERINRLKIHRSMYKDNDSKVIGINKDVENEIKKSQELEDKLNSLIRKEEYYIGKQIAEHTFRYVQLLKGYYRQRDDLMFGNHPKGIDLSQQAKSLEETADYLYRMEVDVAAIRTLALKQHDS